MEQGCPVIPGCWLARLAINVSLLLSVVIPASAGTNPTLIAAGDRGYPPYHYLDANGIASGFDVDILDAVAGHLNYTLRFELGDWEEAQNRLTAGEVDIIPMFVSEQRRERFLFSSPFLIRQHLAFGHEGTAEIDGIEALEDQRVALQAGGHAAQTLADLGYEQLVLLDSEPGAIAAVADGRADYALITMYVGYQAIRDLRTTDIVALSPPLLSSDYAFAVTPARPELVNELNLALAELRRSGQFDRLYQAHLADLYTPEQTLMTIVRDGAWIILPLLIVSLFTLFLFTGASQRARRHLQLAKNHLARMYEERREKERAEGRVEYLAYHDPLTGLPNQNAYRRELAETIEQANAKNRKLAVAIIDILDLDVVRQIAGYVVADHVLQSLTKRFRQRASFAYSAVYGPGTFIFILKHISSTADAGQQLALIGEIIEERIDIEKLPLEGRYRCGWTLYPEHGGNADELMRAAELARDMTYEKNERALLYQSDFEPDPRNLTLMSDLRASIASDQLDWAFQPKLDLKANKVIGAEMLVRWKHPVHGPLPPNLFIPLAEKTGVINELTQHLLVKALQRCREWQHAGNNLQVAVNVSGNDLADPEIASTLLGNLDELGPHLILEVTETAIMKDVHACLKNILRLRNQGVSIALDDFGTGYSSLTYLKQLSPEELKIDQSFIKEMQASKEDMAIVKASIELSHELGAKVTAEGIEDGDVRRVLWDLKCDIGQGFGIARPMPYLDFMKLCD